MMGTDQLPSRAQMSLLFIEPEGASTEIVIDNMVFTASPRRRQGVQATSQWRRPAPHAVPAYGVALRGKASPRRRVDAKATSQVQGRSARGGGKSKRAAGPLARAGEKAGILRAGRVRDLRAREGRGRAREKGGSSARGKSRLYSHAGVPHRCRPAARRRKERGGGIEEGVLQASRFEFAAAAPCDHASTTSTCAPPVRRFESVRPPIGACALLVRRLETCRSAPLTYEALPSIDFVAACLLPLLRLLA